MKKVLIQILLYQTTKKVIHLEWGDDTLVNKGVIRRINRKNWGWFDNSQIEYEEINSSGVIHTNRVRCCRGVEQWGA